MAIELTILMPCLNEAETIADCIRDAHKGARGAGARGFEVLVADNASTDGSAKIARREGARVIPAYPRGYGAALQAGIQAARGRYVVMADADRSYNLREIGPILARLRSGWPLVMGTRLRGRILPGAMPWLHRYLGNPVLTFLANRLFRTSLSDYHCGIRGFEREAIRSLELRTSGMEFASEMIIRAALAGMPIDEVPVTYSPAGRSRKPHLRTWHDGWRHLRFLLLYSPRWVLLVPGGVLAAAGLLLSTLLLPGPLRIGEITFDVHTLLATSGMITTGTTLIILALTARAYASRAGLLPRSQRLENAIDRFSLGAGLSAGIALGLLGLGLYLVGFAVWGSRAFGPLLDIEGTLRVMIAGTTLIGLGAQVFFGSFVLSLLGIR